MEKQIKIIDRQMSSRIKTVENSMSTDTSTMLLNFLVTGESIHNKFTDHIISVSDLQIEYLKHYKTLMKYHNMRGELKRDALFNSIIYDEKCTKMPHDCILNIFEYMKF